MKTPSRGRVFGVVLALVLMSGTALASGSGNEVQSSASVKNVGPEDLTLDLSAADEDLATPGVQVSPVPNGAVTVTAVASASDRNGWQDLANAKMTVYDPNGNVYAGPFDAPAKGDGTGKRKEFEAAFPLQFHDLPGTYTVVLTVKDRKDDTAVENATFEYQELLAISLDATVMNFGNGELGPGASTHGAPSSVVVRNAGNVELDLRLSANGLSTADAAALIGPDRIKYSGDETMANEMALSEDGVTDDAFDLAPGAQATRPAFFDIHVPSGEEQYVPADTYTGRIVIGAVVSG